MPISDSEKNRRRALLKTHYDVENGHDIDGIMETFSPEGEMIYNRIPFTDPKSIRDAHALIGFFGTDRAIEDIHNTNALRIREQIRLLLHELGQNFEDIHIKPDGEFQALKKQGANTLYFKSVPMLQDGDFKLVQGPVIMNYLGRKHGLMSNDHGVREFIRNMILPTLKFSPSVHVNYSETVLPMDDGLPKFSDFPIEFGGSKRRIREHSFPVTSSRLTLNMPHVHRFSPWLGKIMLRINSLTP